MPIFSNRSVARMLGQIAPTIGTTRTHDLKRRILKGGQNAISAEWEIAATYCLAQEGRIRVHESRNGIGDLDLIYSSHKTAGEVAIEITAISDESFHKRNPVYAFNDEIHRLVLKYQLHAHGGVYTQIGDVSDARGPILGIPLKKDFAAFFASAGVRDFFARVRATPSQDHVYRFTERGASSALVYKPGRIGGGGGHLSHTVLRDPTRNPITTRLKAKDRQIRNAGLDLPAIVILCDAYCRALSTQLHGLGTVKVEDVVDLFLSGRHHIEQKSRRINAVILWSLHEAWTTTLRGPDARKAKAHVIPNRGETYHAIPEDIVLEIAGAVRHLPPIVNMPVNARRAHERPPFYGGYSMVFGGEHILRVKLSLLGVQQVLAREISLERFAAAHADAFHQIKRVVGEGAMLSDVRIEHMPDRDDDWLELVFDEVAPKHLFDERK